MDDVDNKTIVDAVTVDISNATGIDMDSAGIVMNFLVLWFDRDDCKGLKIGAIKEGIWSEYLIIGKHRVTVEKIWFHNGMTQESKFYTNKGKVIEHNIRISPTMMRHTTYYADGCVKSAEDIEDSFVYDNEDIQF